MRIFITCDSFWEAKVDRIIDLIDNTGYKQYFLEQDYGSSLEGITIVLMCQNPTLNLKQRIRFAKKERKIYLDIILDLNHFLAISQKERERIVIEKIIAEVSFIVQKYKFENFNFIEFENDLKFWMTKIL